MSNNILVISNLLWREEAFFQDFFNINQFSPGTYFMPIRSIEDSPQGYARLGGALYLLIILFGAFAEGFVTNKLLVGGDAAASARNILAAPGLWQVGVAANVLVVGCAERPFARLRNSCTWRVW